MDTAVLRKYLHEHIPLSKAMDVDVLEAAGQRVRLSAPLEPNINHRNTVFGGSASAVAILSAWALLYVRMEEANLPARLVIQSNQMRYTRPIADDFEAVCIAPEAKRWEKFVATFERRKLARIEIASSLYCRGEEVGRLDGVFVAMGLHQPLE